MIYGIDHEADFGIVRENDGKKSGEYWLDASDVTNNLEQACSLSVLIVSNCTEGKPFDIETLLAHVW